MTQDKKTFIRSAAIMMVAVFLSRILGQLRDTLIASWFGQGTSTDIYRAAFSVPDLLYFLIAGGALSSAFIPVFSAYIAHKDDDNAWSVFSNVASVMFIVVSVMVVLCEIFTPQLVKLIAPGFTPYEIKETTRLTRIILPAQLAFFLGGLIMGSLQSLGNPWGQALGPIVYNLGIIAGGLFLRKSMGTEGMIWGALIGAFLGNFLLQVYLMRKDGGKFRWSLDLKHPGVIQVGKLMLPVILGLSLPQVYVLVNRMFASMLQHGIISALDNASKLMQAPLGIFAQSIGIAILPTLSGLAATKQMDEFTQTFYKGLRTLWMLAFISTALMVALAPDIISIIYGYGAFAKTHGAAQITATAMVLYCLGLFASSSQAVLNRAFYAVQDTVTPIVIGTITTIIFFPMNYALMKPFGYKGLALSGSLIAMVHVGWMLLAVKKRIKIDIKPLGMPFVKLLSSGIITWLVCAGLRMLTSMYVQPYAPHIKLYNLFNLLVLGGIGTLVYMACAKLMGCEEINQLRQILNRRRAKSA